MEEIERLQTEINEQKMMLELQSEQARATFKAEKQAKERLERLQSQLVDAMQRHFMKK